MQQQRRYLVATNDPVGLPGKSVCATLRAVAATARRKGFGRSICRLSASSLRPLIKRLHRQHRRLGGERVLPDLSLLTTHPLQQLAAELTRANRGLKGAAS